MAKSRIIKILILILNVVLYLIYGNHIVFILFSSISTYYLGRIIKKNKNVFLVAFTYLLILMPLIFYKYIIQIANVHYLVPLGISYYTLSLISYISDIYHDKYACAKDLLYFLLYSLYFPCLFVGPIIRYNDFSVQIEKITFVSENAFSCFLRISFGLIKKLIIANKLNVIVLALSSHLEYTGLYVLFGCITYSILLYCDFSGGVDIVLGISKLFNIDLIENFNKPYLSETVKEFWQRWHISLGTWLKNYIYIPMGGNREGKRNTKINILVTLFISGAWHGMHYILWGIINGILVIINFKTKRKYINRLITFFSISLLWIFFIYNNTIVSLKMFLSLFKINGFSILKLGLNIWDYLVVVFFLILVIGYYRYEDKIISYMNKISLSKKIIFLLVLVVSILLFGNYGLDVNSKSFVYGNF